jgi:hypothetical protein
VEIYTAEPLSHIPVGDYLYEVSSSDRLIVPHGHILQVTAKQHVISTHAGGSSDAHHKGLRKSGSDPRRAFLKGYQIPSTSVWIDPKAFTPFFAPSLSIASFSFPLKRGRRFDMS